MDKKIFIPIIEGDDGNGSPIWWIADYLDKNYDTSLLPIIKQYALIKPVGPRQNMTALTKQAYDESLRAQVPNNFCLYPFTNFQLDPDGRARPCCKYKVGDPNWQNDVPKLPKVNIDDLWHQPEYQDLRSAFLKGERPPGCKACWDEEDAGIPSMRLTKEQGGKQFPYATFFKHIPNQHPKSLDLKLSNLCNLKCRICTPFLSTQWIKEIKDLNIQDMGTVESFTNNSKEKFMEDPQNEQIMMRWASGVDTVEFYGGEPLLQQEHDRILKIIHDHGQPESTELFYNTNSTICKESLFDLWKPFKEVFINFSVDDIFGRFEYQRHNAKWTETLENIKLYQEYSIKHDVNMRIMLYLTVGILNVYYIKEFIEEMEHFGIKILLNMVHYPHHYSIVNLPTPVKDIVKQKLLSIPDHSLISPYSPTIDNIINFMYGHEYDPKLLSLFFKKTATHDEYRKESFEKTFPEINAILSEYNV